MLKSIQSNNSPGHSHNRLPSVVDLSVDSCPGIILKRNNKMKQYVVKRFWGVEEIVVEAKNEEHAKEVADNDPNFSLPNLDYEEVELLSVKKENKVSK